jgi:hypothetical protein
MRRKLAVALIGCGVAGAVALGIAPRTPLGAGFSPLQRARGEDPAASAGDLPPAGAAGAVALGAPRTAWIRARGQPVSGEAGERFDSAEVAIEVQWVPDAAGEARAARIELQFVGGPVPVAEAHRQARRFHPADTRAVRTYTAPAGQTVEVFRSRALALVLGNIRSPLGAPLFGDEPPGTFIQFVDRAGSTAARVVVALGNRPELQAPRRPTVRLNATDARLEPTGPLALNLAL